LAFTFFIKTYAHSKDKENMPKFTARLCEIMKVFTPASKWFLQKYAVEPEETKRMARMEGKGGGREEGGNINPLLA
jgi:hypothetical protein